MAQLDSRAHDKCSVCHQPFYDPEQGSVKDYRYTARYVSDAHRVMFHSGNNRDLNYDPDFYAAFDRIQKRQEDNAARVWRERMEGAERLEQIAKSALDVSRETEV